jgi:SAM-dependent methyltransferase
MAKGTKDLTVFDACCGIGGNTIGFARHGAKVFAVELRADLLDLAKHNAIAFGVRAQITFKKGEALTQKPPKTDICFVDPPWGVDWNKTRCTLDSFPLAYALWEAFRENPQWGSFWLKVPSSFDPRTLGVTGQVIPIFGAAAGDTQRIKFLLIKVSRANLNALPH